MLGCAAAPRLPAAWSGDLRGHTLHPDAYCCCAALRPVLCYLRPACLPACLPRSDASRQLRVPMPFLTTIVVPIVGNAAEHASALLFAVKNRMEISLGVAMGE